MSPLPKLLDQLDKHFGLSANDKKYIKETREHYNSESVESLEATAEANKQSLVHMIGETRYFSMKIIILDEMVRTRKELANGSRKSAKR